MNQSINFFLVYLKQFTNEKLLGSLILFYKYIMGSNNISWKETIKKENQFNN